MRRVIGYRLPQYFGQVEESFLSAVDYLGIMR
jgi:hypothetical protein